MLQRFYISAIDETKKSDDIFFDVIGKVIEFVIQSSNFVPIPNEELDICASIIVVSAFMKCKIFKNPPKNVNS